MKIKKFNKEEDYDKVIGFLRNNYKWYLGYLKDLMI